MADRDSALMFTLGLALAVLVILISCAAAVLMAGH